MAHRLAARDGVDLAALSPKDANAQRRPKAMEVKTKTAAQLKAAKDKDHPQPPPPEVTEPPSTDRPDGASYHVGKLLGKGGFAICYGGQLMPTKQRFALKIVKSHMPPKMEQKFQTELQIHSKMRYKNIVQFFRAFAFEESTYLVLELCPNGSLMDMVKRRKGLTEPEVRFYTVQIAGAIKYMHGKGIIHRDLKMGNIFLDSRMNAKIGDFGLAALSLTGKDVQTIRRTTLCGTPNYIAPEILEKGKKGHDHNVDIWSLGIIVFAMLTSKPPFQSSTTDEIYRRARERDYEWPSPEDSRARISQDAKDLVATMLTEADLRPEPDVVVSHQFFLSGFMPAESDMSVKLREFMPAQEEFYADLAQLDRHQSQRNLQRMSRDCAVGPWSPIKVVHSQVWKEMAKEEKAGLTPSIPLAKGVVYRPFDERSQEEQGLKPRLIASMSSLSINDDVPATGTLKAPAGLMRQPPQSFAAQQRAQGRPVASGTTTKTRSALPSEPVPTPSGSSRSRTRKEAAPKEVAEPASRSVRGTTRPTLSSARSAPTVPVADKAQSNAAASGTLAPRRQKKIDSLPRATLFSPAEHLVNIAGSQPDAVVHRLSKLQTELERALNSRSMAIISSKTTTPPHPHIVVKWVDYTNRFGLGYILNDGSVGCILRDIPATDGNKTVMLPPAGVFIRGAENHILRRQDERYADRHQPVPMTRPIKFFENHGEDGLTQTSVSPEQFRVPINEDGTAGKLNPGKDSYQHRKRERIILWKKFANYMIAYGRDEAVPSEEMDTSETMTPGEESAQAELVTFYQRFGDVGCWVYCDGHLQFNFPDHTKIVLDATGTWCHFWHLPQEAAERLASTGSIGATALDDRAMLSYPLQTLLNFQTKPATRSATTSRRRPEIDPTLQGIPAANDFRRKIEFIKNVVKEWTSNGGLGNSDMSREKRLRWLGHRETVNCTGPQKHVWVTVGARWGDQRLTTLVDPRTPWELGEDVDQSSRK